jgi:hypothetical protein
VLICSRIKKNITKKRIAEESPKWTFCDSRNSEMKINTQRISLAMNCIQLEQKSFTKGRKEQRRHTGYGGKF